MWYKADLSFDHFKYENVFWTLVFLNVFERLLLRIVVLFALYMVLNVNCFLSFLVLSLNFINIVFSGASTKYGPQCQNFQHFLKLKYAFVYNIKKLLKFDTP